MEWERNLLVFPGLVNVMGSPLLAVAAGGWSRSGHNGGVLTVRHVTRLTLGLLGLMALAGWGLWWAFPPANGVALPRNVGLGAGVLAFSLAFAAGLKPGWSWWLAPLYSLAGGVFMAGLARALDVRFPGVALQSVLVTLGVFAVMWALYVGRWLRATPRLRLAVYAATGGITLVYLLGLLLSLMGLPLAWLGEGGLGAVLWYGFVAVTAALNLVVDFERIERLQRQQVPADYAVYVALGLVVTVVWMYVSILRMLASLRRG